jgi:hypothetical protein
LARPGHHGGKRVDVRPNWKEAPGLPDMTTAAGPVKL